jgi:hypothetical protein
MRLRLICIVNNRIETAMVAESSLHRFAFESGTITPFAESVISMRAFSGRSWVGFLVVVIVTVFFDPALAQNTKGNLVPFKTAVCSMLKNPAAFNGKIVELRGVIVRNYEFAIIKAESGCGGGIDFVYPTQLDPEDKPAGFSLKEDAEYDRFEQGLAAARKADPSESLLRPDYLNDVTATFVGRLDGCPGYDRHGSYKCGFGHLAQFPARLVIKQIKAVAVSPRRPGGPQPENPTTVESQSTPAPHPRGKSTP